MLHWHHYLLLRFNYCIAHTLSCLHETFNKVSSRSLQFSRCHHKPFVFQFANCVHFGPTQSICPICSGIGEDLPENKTECLMQAFFVVESNTTGGSKLTFYYQIRFFRLVKRDRVYQLIAVTSPIPNPGTQLYKLAFPEVAC